MKNAVIRIDQQGNLSVYIDGKPIPAVIAITVTQDTDDFYSGWAVATVKMLVEVERAENG